MTQFQEDITRERNLFSPLLLFIITLLPILNAQHFTFFWKEIWWFPPDESTSQNMKYFLEKHLILYKNSTFLRR